ncbi:MAG: hypothetical protein HXS54_03005 [Theionarchaea archaeon]|nr:hypothetical protein [Theionarchaea archaeon]
MKFGDGIIWIGQSYAEIICENTPPPDSKYAEYHNYCYLDENKKKRCFVHEAELRGCCRKVAAVPNWMTPEESLVFLVHRDKRDKTQGSLFGCYVLKRFEIITDPEVYEGFTKENNLPWPRYLFNDILQTVFQKVEPIWEEILVGENLGVLEQRTNDTFKSSWPKKFKREFSKSTSITFRPRNSPTQPLSEETPDLVRLVEGTVEKLIAKQIGKEEWLKLLQRQDEDSEYALVPWTFTQFEPPRFCSKRLKLAADYLVDALTARITKKFMEELKAVIPSSTLQGEETFKRIVCEIRKVYNGRAVTDGGTLTGRLEPLNGHVEVRGELALFDKPYPIFERKPQASFRGLLRVDGEELIREIVRCYKEGIEECIPEIPYYHKASKKQLVQ